MTNMAKNIAFSILLFVGGIALASIFFYCGCYAAWENVGGQFVGTVLGLVSYAASLATFIVALCGAHGIVFNFKELSKKFFKVIKGRV